MYQILAALCVALLGFQAAKFSDVFILVLVAPFFWLGSGRGKSRALLVVLASAPVLVFLAATHLKKYILGQPILANDQFFLRENIVILATNDWASTTGLALVPVLVLAYAYSLFRGKGSFTRFEVIGSLALALGVAVCGGIFWKAQKKTEQTFHIIDRGSPSVRVFAYSFLIPEARLRLPPQPVATTSVALLSDLTLPPIGRPNIIAVLQESTFAPSFLEPARQEKNLFAQEFSGPLNVHTFGGGTWLSEFAFTTQLSPKEFGAGGLYIFHLLDGRIKRSIFSLLKAAGYKTIVVYPVKGVFINAKPFYESLGIDQFLQPSDLGLGSGKDFKIPDSTFYQKVLETIQQAGDQPVAVLMLTIRQHYPHDIADPWRDYLERYEASDTAYGELVEALKKSGKPTGLIAFGDHQPPFMAAYDAVKYPRNQTNYDIRCVNFACQPTEVSTGKNKGLDITLLFSEAMQRFGFGLDGFSKFQRQTFATCLQDVTACAEDKRLAYNQAFQTFLKPARK